MVIEQNFRVIGTGSYLPERRVSAEAMDMRVGRPVGWCREHVGVLMRHECLPPEDLVTMAERAIHIAMEDAGVDWTDIDAIVDCSTSQYRPIPCNAAHYQARFGAKACKIPCFDIQSTCLGSLVALNLINGMFASGSYRHVLLVASESGMGGVNYQEPESACLIGDGAGAMVLKSNRRLGLAVFGHETYAQHLALCRVDGGGHRQSVFEYNPAIRSEYQFSMDGPGVVRVVLKQLKPMVDRMLAEYQSVNPSFRLETMHWIPHQGSPRALALVRKQLDVPITQFHCEVEQIGNLVAASIPVMFDRVRKANRLAIGSPLMLLGTSAGYSQAALLFQL